MLLRNEQLKQLQEESPNVYFLDVCDALGLQRYLRTRQLITPDESVLAIDRAGEGNMNCTLRVTTDQKSLIVKQSRPWVERFPTIAAPWDRALCEARFYELVLPEEQISDLMPKLLSLDSEARILVLEDLGSARDCTDLYCGQPLSIREATQLVQWLSALHAIEFSNVERSNLANRDMRLLNHEHVFCLPLAPNNGIDLEAITPGLDNAAQTLIDDAKYVQRVHWLGDLYLSDGTTLLHGDLFPGSWLRHATGLCIIDPEFAFFGCGEFDLGVLLAHLYLGSQADDVHTAILATYQAGPQFDYRLALQFCGVEIMRRLIGVAQLPLKLGLAEKQSLLEFSKDLVTRDDLLALPQLRAEKSLACLLQLGDSDCA